MAALHHVQAEVVNMKLLELDGLQPEMYKQLGWSWFLTKEMADYVQSDVVQISERDAENYYIAANEIYDMFVETAQQVIDNKSYAEIGIHENLIPIIEYTWEHDNHWHLYGRFDVAGGINGHPIKLIEFNADTPTGVPEFSILQWLHLKSNNLAEKNQFNHVYHGLIKNFEKLLELNPDKNPTLLLTFMDSDEDESNVEVIGQAAIEAGFEIEYRYLPEIEFSAEEGIFVKYGEDDWKKFDFWFRLYPWEFLAEEEPELIDVLTEIITNERAVVLNPPYTMLFQSKGLLPLMWEKYKYNKYLLETDFKKLSYRPCVEKVFYGREGANVKIFDRLGNEQEFEDGDYDHYPKIYQEFTEFPEDDDGYLYQAGLFFMQEGTGVGFRREKGIICDRSQFIGHIIK